jgi:hypothetical protein
MRHKSLCRAGLRELKISRQRLHSGMRLHRSIAFWSGLLVLAFLAWAWWDSTRYWSRISFGTGTREYSIANLACRLSYSHVPAHPGLPVPLQWSRYPSDSFASELNNHPPAFEWREENGFLVATIAFRVLMMTATMAWLALIYWRYRRWKRPHRVA